MKSLEFINKDLQDFEKALENYKKRKAIKNEEVDEEYIKQMTKEIENYKQIKQDLEILKIIKKYLYPANWNGFQSIEIDDLHSNIEDKKEDFNKLKQSLEEQEQWKVWRLLMKI